jgi:hypothetical protein
MIRRIQVFNSFKDHEQDEKKRRRSMTPEDRLNEVELLRIEGGKFLYEYPTSNRSWRLP